MNNPQQIREVILRELKNKKTSTNKMLLTLGINTNLLNDMRGGQMPSADKLGHIALYLGVSVDHLLGIEKPD